MILQADAAAFLVRYHEVAPRPLHELGIDAGRAMRMTGTAPAGPPLWSVEDVSTTYVDGLYDPVLDRFDEEGPTPDHLRVRVYRPSSAQDLPVLVYFHGGGWSIGSLDGVDAVCRVLAERSDCVVVSVDYRQAPEHPYPAPLQDCWRALRWVATGGLDGVNPSRLAVGGDSAGGNLAAACVLLARDTGLVDVAAQLLIYPPTDAHDSSESTRSCADAPVLTTYDVHWFWDLYVGDDFDRRSTTISPKNASSLEGLPPTAVMTAEFDPIRDDGEDYAVRLAAAGVPVHQHRYAGVFHGFFPLVGVIEAADEAADEAALWLGAVLRSSSGEVVDA